MLIENENISQIIGYLLGVIGSLLLFGGGLITYIFTRHVHDNDCQFSQNTRDHERFNDRLPGRK